MCVENNEYDATASWSGYTYQGKVALYVVVKKINLLNTYGDEDRIGNYFLELEWLEDFSILYDDGLGNLKYQSIHQVKARQDTKIEAYSSALIKLLQKVEKQKNIENAYLHTTKALDYKNDWENSLKDSSVDDRLIKSWLKDIDEYINDIAKKTEFVKKISKMRSNFVGQLKKCSAEKISLLNIDRALTEFKNQLNATLANVKRGFSKDSLSKTSLFIYDNGLEYCQIDEINNLIKEEIKEYWRNLKGAQWKLNDVEFMECVLLCLTGIIDSHITNRHKNYGSTEIEKLHFKEFEEILKSDAPIERCEEYYLYIIKEKIFIHCDEYEKICRQDCEEEKDYSCCELCQINDFKEKVMSMTFKEIYELVIVSNPDINSNLNRLGFIDYCEKNRYFDPFFNGFKDIQQKYGEDKKTISYVDENKKSYLLTTICANGVSRKPIKQICKNIIDNTSLTDIFMDYEVLISKDLESDSIFEYIRIKFLY